ncbi:MAG: SEC-C domain-containing protein, partial [Desulfovibrio sp.]|nr:SEC-C domain-containing protein [Desulfovibrio sp.]
MTKIGRNDPCPCGSGKKYKQCCLAGEAAYRQLLQEQHDAKLRAVNWLMENYGDAVDEAVMNRFFQDEEDDMPERIAELPKSMQYAVRACLDDWIIADSQLILDGEWIRTSDLLLGFGGPLFTASGRRHIEELAASELSLYEVLEVHKGKGLLLRDMVHTGEEPVFAHEVRATEALVTWDTLGARILRRNDTRMLGGGVYPFRREQGKELAVFLVKTIRAETRKKRPKATPREIITFCLIGAWLDSITAPPSIPLLRDAQTKEQILFTTDLYRVSDWQALEDILNAQGDVKWESETVWTWVEAINGELYRSLARLERQASGVLEVECRTMGK